jgi:putative ABC transport system permease protein
MFKLVLDNILRRPLRSSLTCGGIAIAVALLLLIDQIAAGYRAQLLKELNGMGVHLMLVPLGCPYDAAARVLKGNSLETSLPESAFTAAQADPDVAIAAPLVIAAVPRLDQGRTDMFVGLDENGMALKTWWKADRGLDRFTSGDSVILGADAAQLELREPGDSFYSPETRRNLHVTGILQRSGTSDDSLFFVPLRTAQAMFNSSNRLTAVGIRLRDPAMLTQVSARLQSVAGAQVVTQTEMMGTFLTILGTVRTLLQSIVWVALCASVIGLINTLLMSVAERAFEFSLFRAVGASRGQLLKIVALESWLLTMLGICAGTLFCLLFGKLAVELSAAFVPFLRTANTLFQPLSLVAVLGLGTVAALLASLFPAWRALRIEPAQALKGGE